MDFVEQESFAKKGWEGLTENKIIRRNLTVPDLLGECIIAVVYFSPHATFRKAIGHLRSIFFLFYDRTDQKCRRQCTK